MAESDSKKLSELRVVHLRIELEKRGLDQKGVKQVLMDRLQKALTDEGEDPETYLFNPSEEKTPSKRMSVSGKNEAEKTEESNKEKLEQSITETEKETDNEDKSQQKDEDHESPITLTLEEEEKIQDDENMSETTTKEKSEIDEKKSANEEESKEEKEDKSTSEAETTKKEAADSSSGADGKKVPSNANPRAIWISNVAMNTRACDIKQALSQYGKVVGAKVVVNAKYPGTCCFGYVTMGSVEDANKVIENLNNTELNGHIIKIEKFDVVRGEQLKQGKNGRKSPERSKSSSRKDKSPVPPSSKAVKEDDSKKLSDSNEEKDKTKSVEADKSEKENAEKKTEDKEEKDEKGEERKDDDSRKRHVSSDRKSRDSKRTSKERTSVRSRSRDRKNKEILTFDKIRETRERQRLREKERLLREESRRRHEERLRQREIERRQRSEAVRLEREREKLRIEREKIEREKNELIRLERERQKIERERIELEKMELQRTRIRLEEDRRAAKRPAPYRRDETFDDRKRSSDGRHFNEPPPPHFDSGSKLRDSSPPKKFAAKEYKSLYDKREISDKRGSRDFESDRNRHSSSSIGGRPSSGKFESRPYENMRDRDIHERSRDSIPSVSSRVTKDHRFERERDRSPHYRPGDRRVMSDGKPKMPTSSSRPYSSSSADLPHFDSRGPSSSWNAPSPAKPFTNNSKWPKDDSWRSNAPSDRWNNSGRNPNFSGGSNLSMAPACPPPPAINNYPDRFDYKIPSSIRKY